MPEHDPIDDQLTRLAAGLNATTGGDMPFSAADARRRGDSIRRRRTAAIAGASALAVAAVSVPVFALFGGGASEDRSLPAQDPNDTSDALGTHHLLSDGETVYSDGADWFTTDTFEGDGHAGFTVCARDSLGGLGATAIFQRDYELRNTRPENGYEPPEVRGDRLREAVAEFPDAATAAAAYDTILEWVNDCTQGATNAGTPDYRVLQADEITIEGADKAVRVDTHRGPVPEELDPYGDAAYIGEIGLVQVGDRIAFLDSTIVGQDYNFTPEEGGTPVNQMLPIAADLLTSTD